MKASVLIIEDEKEIGELIGMYLKRDGIKYSLCETGEEGLKFIKQEHFDLVVLDINLPGIDGFEFLTSLRKKSNVPVVIVSARESDEDKVLGLGIGADDFVTKPFSPKVLIARIRAHLRRFFDRANDELIRFGSCSINPEGYILKRDGKRIPIPPKEFKLLYFLIKNAGTIKTVGEIYESVWGGKYGDVTTVAVHIQRIRKKIEDDPTHPLYIETVHGEGYRFNRRYLKELPDET
jgi:DNA-binding response OmpR family regulator